ncbi:MAG: YHYH protein [Cyanobacteria bacterium J06560_6]
MKKVGLIVLGVSAAIALLALDVRSLTMQPDQESIAQEATSQEATPQEATPDVPEELPEELPAETNCTLYKEAVGLYLDPEAIDCSAEFLEVAATGLPDLDVESAEDVPMVGISSWIQRVPVPYDYNWRIPLSPTWLPEPVEASARGPIAVAVDGVPIFHYERRPDVSTSLDNYEARNDTVIQGELDQCGGHSGQGEDYHYHYAPVCLMDKHNPELPIAFGLDGTPIYYGEGGDEYYGRGRYTGLSYLPDEELNECNALQLPDGGFVHFTTKTPPYVVGCHHGAFDRALQVEPRPFEALAQRTPSPLGGSYGEPVSTLMTDFERNENGEYRLAFDSLTTPGVTSTILYRQVSEGCWEFEYQLVEGERGQTVEACRHQH